MKRVFERLFLLVLTMVIAWYGLKSVLFLMVWHDTLPWALAIAAALMLTIWYGRKHGIEQAEFTTRDQPETEEP